MRKTRLFLISLCVLMLATALFAQDETPTALPTETPTQLPTETPLPTATPLPTETATLTPTLTPTLTTAPTLTATPVEVIPTLESISATATLATIEVISPTATSVSVEIISLTEIAEEEIEIVPVVSSTATSSPTLTAIPAISATVTATATLTQTATAIPFVNEPALMTLVTDDFELGELFLWTASKNWSFAQVESGTVLQSTAGVDPLTFAQTNMLDVSATIRVQLNGGSMAMHLRESGAGRYSLSLNANGILALYRDTTLLEGTSLAPLETEWHTLTLSVIGDILRVKVDDVTLLAVQDPSPLSAGGVSIASVDGSPLRVDDFELAVPMELVPSSSILEVVSGTSTPTMTPIIQTLTENDLDLVFSDNFTNGDLSDWMLNSSWGIGYSPTDYIAEIHTNDKGVVISQPISNSSIEARFVVRSGSVRFYLRDSEAGQYIAEYDPSGQIGLYRNGILLDSMNVSSQANWDMKTIRFSSLYNRLIVTLDNIIILDHIDNDPLPAGQTAIAGYFTMNDSQSVLYVEKLTVWADEVIEVNILQQLQGQSLLQQQPPPLQLLNITAGQPLDNHIVYAVWKDGTVRENIYVREITSDPTAEGTLLIARNGSIEALPKLSPGGNRLVFMSSKGGDNDSNQNLYRIDLTQQTQFPIPETSWVPLTTNESLTYKSNNASWSPNGGQIAYQSNHEGIWKIYIMNADGTGKRRLTNNDASISEYEPTWSPDGSQIAYAATMFGGGCPDFNIYVNSSTIPEGGTCTELLAKAIVTQAGNDQTPAWSPDGQFIAYTTYRDAGSPDIFVHTIGTSETNDVNLTINASSDFLNSEPAWSTDGTSLILSAQVQFYERIYKINLNIQDAMISVINTDWSTTGMVSPFEFRIPYGYPNWTPLAQPPIQIVGTINSPTVVVSYQDGDADLYIANGSILTTLTDTTTFEDNPVFSPDGTRIAFERNNAIYTINVDGTGDSLFVSNGSEPTWSPDGTRIAFVRGSNIHIGYTVGTVDEWQLTNHTASRASDPAFSPDGRWIAYTQGDDFYLVDGQCSRMASEYTGNYQTCMYQNFTGSDNRVFSTPAWHPYFAKLSNNELAIIIDDELYVITTSFTDEEFPRPNGIAGEIQFTNNSDTELSPVWSSDGTEINFVSDRNGFPSVFKVLRSDGNDTNSLEIIRAAETPDIMRYVPCPDPNDYNLLAASNVDLNTRISCFWGYRGIMFTAVYHETSDNRMIGYDEIEAEINRLALEGKLGNFATYGPMSNNEAFADFNIQFSHRYLFSKAIVNGMINEINQGENPIFYFPSNFSCTVDRQDCENDNEIYGPNPGWLGQVAYLYQCPIYDARGNDNQSDSPIIVERDGRPPRQVFACIDRTFYNELSVVGTTGPNWLKGYRDIFPHLYSAIFDAIVDNFDILRGGIGTRAANREITASDNTKNTWIFVTLINPDVCEMIENAYMRQLERPEGTKIEDGKIINRGFYTKPVTSLTPVFDEYPPRVTIGLPGTGTAYDSAIGLNSDVIHVHLLNLEFNGEGTLVSMKWTSQVFDSPILDDITYTTYPPNRASNYPSNPNTTFEYIFGNYTLTPSCS